jgi:hypothetical protein
MRNVPPESSEPATTPVTVVPDSENVGSPLTRATGVPGGKVMLEATDARCSTTSRTGA